jgi:excisionase family DNA binding protein
MVTAGHGGDWLRWKGIQMKGEDAKTSHYTGPIKVMTVREVSAYLQVHPSTIYRLLKHHQIPAFHVGSDWRFNIEAIDRWILQQGNPGD